MSNNNNGDKKDENNNNDDNDDKNNKNNRKWDLVIYGATGDAGTAIATYVANHFDSYQKKNKKRKKKKENAFEGKEKNENDDDDDYDTVFRWAIAGRSETKLNRLLSRLILERRTVNEEEIGVIVVSSSGDEAAMKRMTKSTRLLLSAVGPYTELGETVYSSCVETGTNYVDITGEVDWVANMRTKYATKAKQTGSTMCSFGGYDSVPCDITVHLAKSALTRLARLQRQQQQQQQEIEQPGEEESNSEKETETTTTIPPISFTSLETVTRIVGGGTFPRGTIRTVLSKLPEGFFRFANGISRYPGTATANNDNNVNKDSRQKKKKTMRSLIRWLLPRYSPEFGAFTLPHFMGWCNIPVVHGGHDSSFFAGGGGGDEGCDSCYYHDRLAVPYSQGFFFTGYGLLQTVVLYTTFCLFLLPCFVTFQIVAVFFLPSSVSSSKRNLLLRAFDSFRYRGSTTENQKELKKCTVETWTYASSRNYCASGSIATATATAEGREQQKQPQQRQQICFDNKAVVRLFVRGDPGIHCTALLASETAFSLLSLQDRNRLPIGVIGSPSEIVGDELVERLRGCCNNNNNNGNNNEDEEDRRCGLSVTTTTTTTTTISEDETVVVSTNTGGGGNDNDDDDYDAKKKLYTTHA